MATKKKVVVAPVGDNMDALYVGLKEFSTERIILLTGEGDMDIANETKKELVKFHIPVQIKKMSGNVWEEMFRAVSEIKSIEKNSDLIINVSTGDRNGQCAATSAAYVNGIKAFSVGDGEAMLLPVLKFSYYSMLTDRKMEILKVLFSQKDCCSSLDQLSKKTNMSLPLISYHINGNLKSEGLKQLGLVETEEKSGRTKINLSMLGRLLIKGYVQ